MKTFLTALLGAIMMLFSLSSCTDQYDVDIEYQPNMTITAKNMLKSFTPYKSEDFDPKSVDALLNIDVLFYDAKTSELYRDYEFHFESEDIESEFQLMIQAPEYQHAPFFEEGEYSVIAIAHFSIHGSRFSYWKISNTQNLNDLTIDAQYKDGEYIYTSPFETLGIYAGTITVKDKPINLNIDIMPVTALFQVWMTNASYTGIAYDRLYSTKCLNAVYNTITAPTIKDKVIFKDGKPEYVTSEQIKDYTIYYSNPLDELLDDAVPTTRCYRALLPETGKSFDWTVDKGEPSDPSLDEIIKKLIGPYPDNGSSNSMDIVSGKQYCLSMVLDAPNLWLNELGNESYVFESVINDLMFEFNKQRIRKTLECAWENAIGLSLKEVEHYFNTTPYEKHYHSNIDRYIAKFSPAPSDQYYFVPTAAFLDKDYNQCVGISLTISVPGGNIASDREIEYIIDLLNQRFTYNKRVGDVIGYFVGSKEDATKIVVFDFAHRDNVCLHYRDREHNW